MKKFALLLAGIVFPAVAMAAGAPPGPDWAFMTPDPNAPAPAAAGGGGGGGGAATVAPPQTAGALQIVLNGKGDAVRPCNTCHTPSGMGQPESANIRGLNAAYFERQMQDFKSGARGGPRSGAMAGFAKGMTDADIKAVAAYYSELTPAKWTKVSEAAMAPKTMVGRNSQRTKMPGSDMEQVGNRIIEVADNPANIRQMAEPAFVAYVPQGSMAEGKKVAADAKCGSCHGANLRGAKDVPGIAGRSPVYIARQIYSFKNGVRKGTNADIMKNVVAKLSDQDVIGVSSYVSSMNPS